jgi:cellulose synthase/poly-beta-1,6-N-acetylglucosamine synthase-like glycosyltransferase
MDLSTVKLIEYGVAFLALYVTIFYILIYAHNRKHLTDIPPSEGWEPKISVITPAYNEEHNIARCLDSLLNSDYPKSKLEIIVIDDGSRDSTLKIAKSYEKKGVKVFHKKNSGKANSLNYGIGRATGEIIATLDADSYIMPDTIRKMLPHFNEDAVVAVTAAVKTEPPRNFIQELQKVEYIYTLFSRRILCFIDAVHVTPGPFSMFRKWIFDEIGGFDPNNILEDQEIAMRIQSYNYKIRSSLDASVYTEVPESFMGLLNQRTRWHRGGLHNAAKYTRLIGPGYGDLGMIVMPLGLIAVAAIFAVIFVSIYYYFFTIHPAFVDLGSFLFLVNPIHIIGATILILTLGWVFAGMHFFRGEGINPLMVLFYIVSYAYLITLFWLSAIFKELTMKRMTWEAG